MDTEYAKHIYLVISHTNNRIAKTIRKITGYKYNHVSVSLNENLVPLVSFARQYFDTPLYGGFVNESADRFRTQKGNAEIKVFAVTVSPEQYEKAKEILDKMRKNRRRYIYNLYAAAGFVFGRDVKIADSYTCAQFAQSLLTSIGERESGKLPHPCTVKAYDEVYGKYTVYEGEFPASAGSDSSADGYNTKHSAGYKIKTACLTNRRLLRRMKKRA